MTRFLAAIGLLALAIAPFASEPKNFVFFSQDREKIHSDPFLDCQALSGAQITYSWRQLEPAKDSYDFSMIREDLQFLQGHHKRLWVQLQDVTFMPTHVCVPKYIQDDPEYHGGVAQQYAFHKNDVDDKQASPEGWVAKRWDPAVRMRFQRLLVF